MEEVLRVAINPKNQKECELNTVTKCIRELVTFGKGIHNLNDFKLKSSGDQPLK